METLGPRARGWIHRADLLALGHDRGGSRGEPVVHNVVPCSRAAFATNSLLRPGLDRRVRLAQKFGRGLSTA